MTSLRRKPGTVTSRPSAASATPKPSAVEGLRLARPRDDEAQQRSDLVLAQADRRVGPRLAGKRPGVDRAADAPWRPSARPSAGSRRSGPPSPARAQGPSRSARTPRCAAPGVGRAVDVRPDPGGRPPSARASCRPATSERAPPMTPAIDVGPSASSMTSIVGVERPRLAVERLDLLAVASRGARSARRRRRGRGRRRAAAGPVSSIT